MDGLKPPSLYNDTASLENSYNLWQEKEEE